MLYERFSSEDIFAPLYGMWKVQEIHDYREQLLGRLAEAMVKDDSISIIYEANLTRREKQLADIVEQASKTMGASPLEAPMCL